MSSGTHAGRWRVIAWNLIVLAAIFGLGEAVGALLLANPGKAPAPFLRGMRHYYFSHDRNIIQMREGCGQYDPGLGYTLRPGQCEFKNREFATTVRVNSLGTRDDEASLSGPEIVVVGDSYAMGWGVDQGETFADLLQRDTGRRVLNLAVSSYGTAREMTMLSRADRSRLAAIVIQYCENDYYENTTFRDHGNSLPIMNEATYLAAVASQAKASRYFPGKYTLRLLPAVARYPVRNLFFKDAEDEIDAGDEAAAFLNVLAWHGLPAPGGAPVIVLELNEPQKSDNRFAEALEAMALEIGMEGLTVLRLAGMLGPEDYFVLDSHIRPSGHGKVAAELVKTLAGLGVAGGTR